MKPKKIIIHHFEKNGHAMVMFGRGIEIVGIYDERDKYASKDCGEILNIGKMGITITNDFEGLIKSVKADMVVTGGEGLYFTKPENVKDWKKNVVLSLKNGMDVYSMSKIFYGEKTRSFKEIAKKHGSNFLEASDPESFLPYLPFAERAKQEGIKTPVITFVGTSMNSGKVTALLVARERLEKNLKVGFIGTEPSSIFVGADEQVIPEVMPTIRGAQAILGAVKKVELEKKPDLILVGGQTGLTATIKDVREARAGAIVAWQILLGSEPDKVVLCAKAKNVDKLKTHISLIQLSTDAEIASIIINGKGEKKEKIKELVENVEKEMGIYTLDVFATPEKIPKFIRILKGG